MPSGALLDDAETETSTSTLPLSKGASRRKVVVVHTGARDAYQLALAMSEADMLQALVTDLYSPDEQGKMALLMRYLPSWCSAAIAKRMQEGLPSDSVETSTLRGLWTLTLQKLRILPDAVTHRVVRSLDRHLGRTAGKLAVSSGADLISYSYYGYDAFQQSPDSRILFQVHPHPLSVRRILREELSLHPECAASLNQEWELALSEEDFDRLVAETRMAKHYLVASSFTRDTLVEHGARHSDIAVIPYGVDLDRFQPASYAKSITGSLKLLFVGRINQRKGVAYLLDALKMLPLESLEVTVIGHVVDGLEIFKPFKGAVKVRPSVSREELVQAYREADLFVFPSVAEGFGQVLLEALASGLPIVSTTHTAAPDLISDGVEGFVIAPRRPDLLAQKIEWAMSHRSELQQMGHAARERAKQFSWALFRERARNAVKRIQSEQSDNDESTE